MQCLLMPDVQKVAEIKQRILSALERSGPSFPSRIARDVSLSPLFIAALLSELLADRKVKTTSMKVGSSPIYFIPGQEPRIQEFANYLNAKEREAFEILKKQEIVEDTLQEPAIRVALRKISDFAIPLTVHHDTVEKTFWKFYTLPDQDIQPKIEHALGIRSEVKEVVKQEQPVHETTKEKTPNEIPQEPKKKQKTTKENEFGRKIKDYLLGKDIELLAELAAKPREFVGKVRIDTHFGKQEFYLIAKDKKKIAEEEIIVAVQRAQLEKMPALLMAPGEPDKQAKEYLKEWRNLVKFERVKL